MDQGSELGKLTYLRALRAAKNQLNGDVPTEIGSLDSLRSILLCDNQIEGLPDLSGLIKLNYLWVWNNNGVWNIRNTPINRRFI